MPANVVGQIHNSVEENEEKDLHVVNKVFK